jgi:hypothetical protein
MPTPEPIVGVSKISHTAKTDSFSPISIIQTATLCRNSMGKVDLVRLNNPAIVLVSAIEECASSTLIKVRINRLRAHGLTGSI